MMQHKVIGMRERVRSDVVSRYRLSDVEFQSVLGTTRELAGTGLSGPVSGFSEWIDRILGQTSGILDKEQLARLEEELGVTLQPGAVRDARSAAASALEFARELAEKDRVTPMRNVYLLRDSVALYAADKLLGQTEFPPALIFFSKAVFREMAGLESVGENVIYSLIEQVKEKKGYAPADPVPPEEFSAVRAGFFDLFYSQNLGRYKEQLLRGADRALHYLGTAGLLHAGGIAEDRPPVPLRFIDTTKTGSLVLFLEGAVRSYYEQENSTPAFLDSVTDGWMFYSRLSLAFSHLPVSASDLQMRATELSNFVMYPVEFHSLLNTRHPDPGQSTLEPQVRETSAADRNTFLLYMVHLRNELLILLNIAS